MTINQKALKLLPCPFCGETPSIRVGLMEFVDGEVQCECGASGGNFPNETDAISAWNRRAALPASDHAGLVERLESALRDMPSLNHASIDKAMYRRTMLVLAATVREAATALSAASPAPLEGVTDELVERAFKDGLAYGSNVEGADPETAWMQSRVRASLTKDQSNG